MAKSDVNEAFRSGAWSAAAAAAAAAGTPITLSPEDFGDIRVEGYDMRHVVWVKGRYSAVCLCECDMRGAVMRGSSLVGFMLLRSLAAGLLLERVQIVRCIWSRSDLTGARFEGVVLDESGFANCSLQSCVFVDCEVVRGSFGLSGCDISGADVRGLRGLAYNSVAAAKWLESSPPLLPDALERRVKANQRHFKSIDTPAGRYMYDSRHAEKFGSHRRDI